MIDHTYAGLTSMQVSDTPAMRARVRQRGTFLLPPAFTSYALYPPSCLPPDDDS